MQTQSRLFDDLARLATGAAGVLAGIKEELEAMVRHRVERLLAEMEVVPRDEFEAVRAMAAKARSEQQRLERRVAELEARIARPKRPPAAKRPPAKGRARKADA
jgi:BMFP domain-containing protein YqiC